MLQTEIQQLTLEFYDIKAQALGQPPDHQESDCVTGSNPIATNTTCDEPSSQKEQSPLEIAAVDTTGMRKGTSNGPVPASTLHQYAAHIKQGRRTLAGTKPVCSYCNTRAKHRSNRCPLKTAIGNHMKVNNQPAPDSLT